MKKFVLNILAFVGLFAITATSLTSCSDEPDSANFSTFTGKTVSSWLDSNPNYSDFNTIVDRAGLKKLLSSYGRYTCFVPDNGAIDRYLAKKEKTLMTLTDADCDTIARTHIIDKLYKRSDLDNVGEGGVISDMNMMKLPVKVFYDYDTKGNSVVKLNGYAEMYFELQDDTVSNGVLHPINEVLENPNDLGPNLVKKDPNTTIFYDALEATGLSKEISKYKDENYQRPTEFKDYKSGSEPVEYATAPDEHLFGFTTFVVPDAVLKAKYPQFFKEGVSDLRALYDLACSIYDNVEMFNTGDLKPTDEEHSFENIKNPKNPLYRFMAYHILRSNVMGYNNLTVRDDFGVVTSILNPTDWYYTMLPHTMMKVEHVTVSKWSTEHKCMDYTGAETTMASCRGERFLNRRVDDIYNDKEGNDKPGVEGVHIHSAVAEGLDNTGVNGVYFYVDDILKFDDDVTRDVVQNCRIRMDMSTVFPELTTNNIRMNGDRTKTGEAVDHTVFMYGRNYFFPNGYLDGVNVGGNGYFIYRRPRQGYWSLHGDEFICQGDYDITFRIPPVPFESDWQVRLGYAAMRGIRGIAQIYFGDDPNNLLPVGIPLDMNLDLRDILFGKGSGTGISKWENMSETAKSEERKTLKNKGYYRGTNGGYRTGGSDQERFVDIYATLRIVLTTSHMFPGKDYYIRIRAVSSKSGNDNEAMLDYLELVPKSVYGVTDGAAQEDDL